jgi:hypothetical protein
MPAMVEFEDISSFVFDLLPNLAESCYGWSPVHLLHKIENNTDFRLATSF